MSDGGESGNVLLVEWSSVIHEAKSPSAAIRLVIKGTGTNEG